MNASLDTPKSTELDPGSSNLGATKKTLKLELKVRRRPLFRLDVDASGFRGKGRVLQKAQEFDPGAFNPREKNRTSNRFHFTKRSIDALPLPPAGGSQRRVYYYDDQVRGLALAVAPSGKKTFLLYRKVAGKPERVTIGQYPDYTVDNARKEAEQLNGSIAGGLNPANVRREIRAESTLGELFDTYIENHAKPHKRSWPMDVQVFDNHFSRWRNRKLSTIKREDVILFHNLLGRKHPHAANKALELLRLVYNRARIDYGYQGANPAEHIRFFERHARERFLEAHELPAFFDALSQEQNGTIKDFLLVALLTGARRRNVQSMAWSEINFRRALWTIPHAKAKGKKSMDVTLSPVVLEILERRRASSLSLFVFPGAGASGHLEEPKKAWRRILKRAGLSDLRIHDLRRTLGSWQAALGTSLPIIGKSLGHSSLEATQIYSRLELDPVRQSVERAGAALLAAGRGPLVLEGRK